MGFTKRLLLVFGIFIILVIIISLFLPSNIKFEKNYIINADKNQVYNQVNDLKNWKNWSVWISQLEATNSDNFLEINSSNKVTYQFQNQNSEVNNGKIKILESNSEHSLIVEVELEYSNLVQKWLFKDIDGGVEVILSSKLEFGFNPINKFVGLFLENKLVKDYETSLNKLKLYSENLPKIHSVKVEKSEVENIYYLSIRDTINPHEVNNAHGKMYAQINQFMDSSNISISGSPLVIYHQWSDTLIDMEAALPISDSLVLIPENRVKFGEIKGGKVVTAIHYGSYDRLPETYYGINEWMRKNKVIVSGPLWEVYLTDPAIESNPEKWQTAIYFPIN